MQETLQSMFGCPFERVCVKKLNMSHLLNLRVLKTLFEVKRRTKKKRRLFSVNRPSKFTLLLYILRHR